MDQYSFRTLAQPSEGGYREKGSRFLAFAYPVSSDSEIDRHLDAARKKYFDARHHCYAWMLGPEGKLFRAFDAGEPNHSAGDPILGQIRSRGVTDVLVIVVRYFGGVKLGVGGLVTAYKSAAADALDNAVIIEKNISEPIQLQYDYEATPEVMRLVKEFELQIVEQTFESDCMLRAEVELRHKRALFERLELLKALNVKLRW